MNIVIYSIKHITSLNGVNQVFYITLLYKRLMDIAKKIGNNLKQARKDKKMTQTDVAKLLYMTQQQYSRFENGVFELNYAQIIFLCDLFDISANDLFSMS